MCAQLGQDGFKGCVQAMLFSRKYKCESSVSGLTSVLKLSRAGMLNELVLKDWKMFAMQGCVDTWNLNSAKWRFACCEHA